METGEGKSTICAMLAVLLALRGEVVDIVTSSSLLAQRDAKERAPFYAMFGLSVAHNTGRTTANRPKECYRKNIVYGDTLSFAVCMWNGTLSTEWCQLHFSPIILSKCCAALASDAAGRWAV